MPFKTYRKEQYSRLLEDANLKRWYNNNSKSSLIVADVYLRALGRFCYAVRTDPAAFVRLSKRRMEEVTQDFIDDLERAGKYSPAYIESYLKAIRSWAAWNRKPFERKIKVSSSGKRPTLENERVPSQEELGSVLYSDTTPLRTRAGIALIAFSGLRLETLGDYLGLDGLRVRDVPEMEIRDGKVTFTRIPAMIVVREELSKSRRRYFTFMCEEGCEIIRQYLERRIESGESIGPDTGLIITDRLQSRKSSSLMRSHNSSDRTPFLRTTKIGNDIRRAMRAVGLPWRPYVWRSYFDTNLMLAESKGMVSHAYQQFWMGHVGDIESEYTVRKNRLPDKVVEDMRKAYERSSDLLQTRKKASDVMNEEKLKNALKEQLMMIAGYTKEELSGMDLSSLSNEDVQEAVRRKLAGMMNGNGSRQKVAHADDIEQLIAQGWEFVSSLPNGKVILKLPF
jgi:integrase